MENKAIENKTIKTIVPIKGNLLEKIKNKLKKNGSTSQISEVNDVINNNKNDSIIVPKLPVSNRKPSKIEIQKIEKVNLKISDIITSTKSEPVKMGRNTLLREASPKPLIVSKPVEAEKSEISKLEAPFVETLNKLQKIDNDDNSIITEEIELDIPCSSHSLQNADFEAKKIKEKEKNKHAEKNVSSKNVETINSNVSEEEDEGELMDISEEEWLHDISAMIGEARIREIDDGLKKIPTVVTGNRIQTENVELKLIIHHLLGKLNAKSVTETLDNQQSSFYDHLKETDMYSDNFDELSTDYYDDDESNMESGNHDSTMSVMKEATTDKSSFSIPLENSVAIVTIPAIAETTTIEPLKVDPPQKIDPTKVDLPKKGPQKGTKQKAKVEKEIPVVEEQTKKRRGRPPLATSTAKKPKKSIINDTPIKQKPDPVKIDHPRKSSLRPSSRESSVESFKEPKKSKSLTNAIESSPVRIQRSSSRERSSKAAKDTKMKADIKSINKSNNKKVTRVQELKDSENDTGESKAFKSESSLSSSECENELKPQRSSRKTKLKADSSHKITKYFGKEENETDSKIAKEVLAVNLKEPPKKQASSKKKSNGQRKSALRKRKILSDASESDSECETLCKLSELKSIAANDSNSPAQSSIIERYDYLNKSSLFPDKPKTEKNVISEHPICADLNDMMNKCKELDPTYVKPQDKQKRKYLITSAFKGNHINSDDSSHSNMSSSNTIDSCTRQPSVSRDDSSIIQDDISNGQHQVVTAEIKDRMQELISKQKDKIKLDKKNSTQSMESTTSPLSPKLSSRKPKPAVKTDKRKLKTEEVDRKVFEQEPLESTKEKLVCYDEIVEAVRIADAPRPKGRASNAVKPLEIERRNELRSKLQSLDNFKCGNCNNLVAKHKWKDHLIQHGGVAWIESFESPIDINDWNESVRRLNNYLRIFKLDSLRCPNCNFDKKSALGHLSHIYTCGESEETIESRKVPCQYCEERVLPYNMSWHRSKCKVLNKTEKEEPVIADDEGDDEEENENSRSSFSGRTKRKAGKKAEKTFKLFIKKLDDDAMDQIIATTNGQYICNHCSQKFETKQLAVEHLNKDHSDKIDGNDFEASDSDAIINEESSTETESSGVESSAVQSVDEDDECDSNNVSNSKGKQSSVDTQEYKNARKVISSFAESYHNVKISSKTINQTKKFINDNLCDNILTEFSPKYKMSVNISIASYLIDSKFEMKSMKFFTNIKDYYVIEYGKDTQYDWNQLDVGQSVGDHNSLTFFCGGSVSSLDWSQSMDGNNYLAVACNNTRDRSVNLEETSISCIQIYEFKNLVNETYSSFENSSKFLYFFSINEGPVWSIKFHPMIVPNKDRLGLLAVTSSNHKIYIYSLPYLKTDDNVPVMISLDPSFTCKTYDGFWLFQDKYLMQATMVSWFYRKEHNLQLLAAGFINGMISIWKLNDSDKPNDNESTTELLPYLIFQPHREPITALDFKFMFGTKIYLLTAALDRDLKVFIIDNSNFQELSTFYAQSRLFCAEWWLHWPGFIFGNDSCYSAGSLIHRQPVEFGLKNTQLFICVSSVTNCNINHWLNLVLFTTEAGDVMQTNPSQMMTPSPKDRWQYFNNNILSYTDVVNLDPNNSSDLGIIFNDIKSKVSKRPSSFRNPLSTNNINQLQINQISFNRNEKSYRFYALGYETGFVRIRHLKNFK